MNALSGPITDVIRGGVINGDVIIRQRLNIPKMESSTSGYENWRWALLTADAMAGGCHLRHRIGFAIAAISLIPMALSITEAEALLQFKSTLKKSEALSTWVALTSPCDKGTVLWKGVECSQYDVVIGLRLDSMGLEGAINVSALMNLVELETISLENNSFTGLIPEFNRISSLKAIQISKNRFSGEIPGGYFEGMVLLRSVRFENNRFSGEVPWSLDKVPNLVELGLQNNQFSGQIPDLEQKTLKYFNVSNNRLYGEIPEALQRFNASSFAGNAELCGLNLKKPCNGGELEKGKESVEEMIDRAIMMGGGALLTMVVMALLMIKVEEKKTAFDFPEKSVTSRHGGASLGASQRKGFGGSSKRTDSVKISDMVVVNEEKGVFGLADVMKAGAESLGDGKGSGFGMSYKAVMASGLTVVVKRMKDCNRVGKEEFEMEMRRLGRVKHPNLLPPLAYHYRRDEKLLITEFIPAGSLVNILHGDPMVRKELNWAVRLKIIKGIARGLDYLHSIFPGSALPHGNLKSSNVLINSNCEPLLSEFGFDPLVNTNQAGNLLFAYKAPEAANYGIITQKCDVFCLGILILEILTGKFPFQYMADGSKGVDVIGLVEMCIVQGRVLEVFDRDLVMNVSPSARLEMEKLLYIGADCGERNPDLRLTLEEAVSRIEQIRYGGIQDYRPSYSSDSLSTSLDSFSSQSQGYDGNNNVCGRIRYDGHGSHSGQHSMENAMIDGFVEIAGSSRRPGKTSKGKHIDLSSRLKKDGYATNQGIEKPAKVIIQVGKGHYNMYGLMDELD